MAVLYEDKPSAIAVMDREIEKLEEVILRELWKQFVRSSFYAVLCIYALVSTVKSVVFAIMLMSELNGGFMTLAVLSVSYFRVSKNSAIWSISHTPSNAVGFMRTRLLINRWSFPRRFNF